MSFFNNWTPVARVVHHDPTAAPMTVGDLFPLDHSVRMLQTGL